MKIGYGIMLDVASHNFVRQIQLELHDQVGISVPRQPPHVTVKSPFEITHIGKHRAFLDALSENTNGLEIEIDGFGHFADKVIYLNIRHTPELLVYHKRILKNVKAAFGEEPQEFEGEHIKFHASIAGFSEKTDFYKAQDYLSRYAPKFKFKVSQLGLFFHLGPGKGWIVHHLAEVLN